MNFQRVVVSDNMHEIMEDDDSAVEAMEDCAPPSAAMDGCARGMFHLNHSRGDRKLPVKERYVEPEYPRLPSEGNLEWQYTMRRTMQEVIPGLFLGKLINFFNA